MQIIYIIWLFILGIIFWSFWSVILIRLGKEFSRKAIKWILFWFSHCPNCKKRLKAKNLVPLLSFFLQKWKCEFCNKKISSIYPTIEIISGFIFVFTYLIVKNIFMYYLPSDLFTLTLIFWLIVNFFLGLLIIYDIWYMELHQVARRKLLLFSLVVQFFASYTNLWDYKIAFVWSIIFGWIFLLIYYFSKLYLRWKYKENMEWIWRWDVMLAFLLGTFLPFILKYNYLEFSIISTFEILILFVIFACVLGLTQYGIQILIKKIFMKEQSNSRKKSVEKEYFPKIAFIPAMIVSFWVLLVKWWFLLNLISLN